jgi:hypothetical protein
MQNNESLKKEIVPIPRRSKRSIEGVRDMIKYIQQFHNTMLYTIIEVGAWVGDATIEFAKNFKHVLTIDPYTSRFADKADVCDMQKVYEEFLGNIISFDNITLVKEKNEIAHKKINKVFFVYLDGLHEYKNIKTDIKNWVPHIRPGGFLCGHDYSKKNGPGVIQAVNEFAKEKKETVVVFKDSSWIIPIK